MQSYDEELRSLRSTITAIDKAVASWEEKIQSGDLDQEEISFELRKAQIDKAACEARMAELEGIGRK